MGHEWTEKWDWGSFFLGKNQKGMAGRGREKERHNILRQTSRQFIALLLCPGQPKQTPSERPFPTRGCSPSWTSQRDISEKHPAQKKMARDHLKAPAGLSLCHLAGLPLGHRPPSTGLSITDHSSLSDKGCPSHMLSGSPAPSCGAPSPVPCLEQHGRPTRSVLQKSARPIWETFPQTCWTPHESYE